MKLVPTNRTDYGLRALIYLVNATGPWTKAAEIGAAMGIPIGFFRSFCRICSAPNWSRHVPARRGAMRSGAGLK